MDGIAEKWRALILFVGSAVGMTGWDWSTAASIATFVYAVFAAIRNLPGMLDALRSLFGGKRE
jgi:hypothetical protein